MSHRTAFAVVNVCQIVFGSLLNGMILFLLIRNFYLLKVLANVILLNLAISDFLACLCLRPYNAYQALSGKYFLDYSDIQKTFLYLTIIASMMLAIIMTLDRYILIVFPIRYHLIVKTARIIYAVLFAWCSALAMSLSIYFAWHFDREI